MVFSDQAFLFIFLPIALALGCLLRSSRGYSAYLLVISLAFYYWSAGHQTWILLFAIALNFFGGLAIGRWRSTAVLVLFIAINVSLLLYYKYAYFLADNIGLETDTDFLRWLKSVALPIGISFFTFQGISYLVDIYRGHVSPERNPIVFGAFKAFFPQLIAGPVVRYTDVKRDFLCPQRLDETLARGIRRFAHGLIKKLLVADTVAVIADAAFSVPNENVTFAVAVLGATAFALQIYFDFSGYSDMAIGLGLMFGIRFNENFHRPYSASSITDFWRRWHISLSQWFRDYVYVPIGGNQVGVMRTYRNLIIVFTITGFWHGAAWTFVFWGLYHGLFVVAERLVWGRMAPQKNSMALRLFYCMPVVVIGWILFRADDIGQAVTFLTALAQPFAVDAAVLPNTVSAVLGPFQLFVLLSAALIFIAPASSSLGVMLEKQPNGLLQIVYLALCLVIATILSLSSGYSPFLYFRF